MLNVRSHLAQTVTSVQTISRSRPIPSPAFALNMASQDSNETTSDRVQLTVDGEIVTTHALPDGTPISADAVLLRLRQQHKAIEHIYFVFLGTEDTVKV